MTTNTRILKATPDQVWDVLADGWLYPLWVVGATRMREVDDSWPEVGSRLHHSVGVWPLTVDDTTEVIDIDPGRSLTLHARARPTGVAQVTISLEREDGGTLVSMKEDAVSGPAVLIPSVVRAPLLTWRNVESLRRLAFVAERRSARRSARG